MAANRLHQVLVLRRAAAKVVAVVAGEGLVDHRHLHHRHQQGRQPLIAASRKNLLVQVVVRLSNEVALAVTAPGAGFGTGLFDQRRKAVSLARELLDVLGGGSLRRQFAGIRLEHHANVEDLEQVVV